LKAAIELDVFSAIGQGSETSASIAAPERSRARHPHPVRFSDPRRILDIAAGHGLLGITIAAQSPTLQENHV